MHKSKVITVLFQTTVLNQDHSARGIGTYTRLLLEYLEKRTDLVIHKTSTLSKSEKIIPDIIHYPFFDFFFNTLPLNPFLKKVVTVHDVIPLVFSQYYKPGIKGKLLLQKQKLALKTAQAVITDSYSSREDIIKYLRIPKEKIHVVYLSAHNDFKPQSEELITRVKLKNNLPEKYLLYVGDINYNKNIPQLIKMMKFIEDPEIKLVCLGRNFTPQEIPEWQWIETQLALSDVANKVMFLPTVLTDSTQELAAIYSGALAYIQPSLYEGFGLPVLEAIRCRVPVVCHKNSSLQEVGGDFVVYSQEPTGESFAQATESVLAWSKTRRENFVRQADKWSEQFSWEKTAEQTALVYKKVLKME